MPKKIWVLFILGLIFGAASSKLVAQTTLTGDWTASLVKDNSKLNLNFQRRTEKGSRDQFGHSFEFSELGLTREQVQNGGPVSFRLVREAIAGRA